MFTSTPEIHTYCHTLSIHDAVPICSFNMASFQGVRGTLASLAYATAKGGMVNMTRSLACDLAPHGITVNAIAPGFIDTRMCEMPDGGHEQETEWCKDIYLKYGRIHLGRAGQTDAIAREAYFLGPGDSRQTGKGGGGAEW